MRTTQAPTSAEAERAVWRSVSRADIEQFVRSLMTAYEVVGVQEKRGRLTMDHLDDPSALLLEYSPQVHSPKKFLFPNWEKLFSFHLGGKVRLEVEKAAVPRVVFGMHPCDLHAVQVLDDCLFEGEADTAYRAKREATVLIGVDCLPDEHCFCSSMGTDRAASGFDLFFHRNDDGYLVQTGSERGERLLQRHAPAVSGRADESPLPLQAKSCGPQIDFPAAVLAPLMDSVYEHGVWREIGDRCLGCGACTLLCPTCYCFNVKDQLNIDLAGGERVRTWDSCQFDQFTRITGGSDFRTDQADRQRHRFFRKYKYLWEKYERTACVGCGRCSRECLARIAPVEVLNSLFSENASPELQTLPATEYQPSMAEIISVVDLTPQEKAFRLSMPAAVQFTPGAFMEVSIFGLGEAPFTIASSPADDLHVEIVVRTRGALTRALHRLKAGDSVGVRGPFGVGYPIEAFVGRDVLLVAGGLGLVTLRSLLLTLMENRTEFGRITLLYGGRTVEHLLFVEDLLDWHRGGLLDCRLAIKEPGNPWGVPTGDITQLFRNLDVNPRRTTAAISGPAEMYRFINPLLLRMGFSDEQIFLNLERHMKCGLGKCGKCRINDVCVCESGPIFPYSRVRHLKEAIER